MYCSVLQCVAVCVVVCVAVGDFSVLTLQHSSQCLSVLRQCCDHACLSPFRVAVCVAVCVAVRRSVCQ